MPRALASGFASAVAAGQVYPAIFVEGLFNGGNLRIWSGIGEITWNSAVWAGAGLALAVDAIQERGDVQALGTSVTLSGIPSDLVSLALAEPYQGRVVRIYQALLTSAGAVVADPDERFTGRCDVMTISDDGQTATITMTVESRLIDLQRPRERRYTDSDQRIEYPADRGLEYVASIQDVAIKWGAGQ